MIRIDKFLSQMQVATRSESKKLIKMKRITKNGALVTDGGEKCDPKKDCICLDGHPIAYQEYAAQTGWMRYCHRRSSG